MDIRVCARRLNWRRTTCVAAAFALSAALTAPAEAADYITLPSGTLLTVDAMNAGGDIAGTWSPPRGKVDGYVLSHDGSFTDLQIRDIALVTGIDDNGDVIGNYDSVIVPNKGWFYDQRQGSILSIKIAPKGVSVLAVHMTSLNVTQGQMVGYYEGNGLYHSFTVSYPTEFENAKITFFDCQNAHATQALTSDSSGDTAGNYQDSNSQWHGFIRLGGGNCTSFDYTSSDGTKAPITHVTRMNDYDEIVGEAFASDGATQLGAYDLRGDSLFEGRGKPNFISLGVIDPEYVATVKSSKQFDPVTDVVLSNSDESSYAVSVRLGTADPTLIFPERCATRDSVHLSGLSTFTKQIAGYCQDKKGRAVGFFMPLKY